MKQLDEKDRRAFREDLSIAVMKYIEMCFHFFFVADWIVLNMFPNVSTRGGSNKPISDWAYGWCFVELFILIIFTSRENGNNETKHTNRVFSDNFNWIAFVQNDACDLKFMTNIEPICWTKHMAFVCQSCWKLNQFLRISLMKLDFSVRLFNRWTKTSIKINAEYERNHTFMFSCNWL